MVYYPIQPTKKKAAATQRGRNGFDGGSWRIGSEPGGHQPVSKVKLLLNIKANEEYALAA